MSVDEKLAELDHLLKGLKVSSIAIASRGFDPELVEMEDALDAARLIVAQLRLEVLHVKEQLE